MTALAAFGGAASIASAATYDWDANGGTGGNWNVAANWNDRTTSLNPANPPTSTDAVAIRGASSAGSPVLITSAATALTVEVGPRIGSTNYTGYLDILANLTVTGAFNLHDKGDGYVTHSAGTLTAPTLGLSTASTATGSGSYALSGTGAINVSGVLTAAGGLSSVFTQSGAATSVHVGSVTSGDASPADHWTYQLSAGTLTVDTSVSRSYGDWLFQQSGGSASIGTDLLLGNNYRASSVDPMEWVISGDSSLQVGNNVTLGFVGDGGTHTGARANGRVTLNGSRGTGSNVTVGGNWRQTGSLTPNTSTDSWGMLQAVIDQDAVNLASNMRKIAVTGNVTFDNGSYLLPEFAIGVTPTAGAWTLMTWVGSLTNNGLVFDPSVDQSKWSFSTAGNALVVNYVPEPGSMTLMAIGGMVLAGLRRRARQ